jgi:hypothetical protein
MLGSNWFWNRVSYKWMVSTQAACLFGLASIFICLLTAFWFGALEPNEVSGLAKQIVWGLFGVFGPLSVVVLWTGMRRYQTLREIRDVELAGKSKLVHLLLGVGIWYGAMIYYFVVYLPARRILNTERFGRHVS